MNQLSELCRACLASSGCLESLDTECEQGYSLKYMLTSFCKLQMDDISVMYDNICKDCSSEILRAYNFKLQCEQNDVLLREKARELKCEMIMKEEEYLKGLEITIKKEVDSSHYYSDENEVDAHVKQENYTRGDEHMEFTENDDTRNDDDHKELASEKKKKPLKKSVKTSSTSAQSTTESVVKGKCGRKKKPIPEEKALLIDNSFQRLGYKKVFECPKCGNLWASFNLVHKHLDKVHDIVLKSVEEFDEMCVQERKTRGIQESREEDQDVKFDPKNPMYKCIDCPYRCKEFEVMKKHMVDQHREAKYIYCCEPNCMYRTHDLVCLVRHINYTHKNKYKFNCELCEFKTHNKYNFDLHHTTKHLNIRPFACQQCDETFLSKQNLQDHIAMKHEKKHKFFCPTCHKGFCIKWHLKLHMKTHLGLKPHVCEHCGMAFTQKGNLDKHVFTSHFSTSEDSVLCSECPFKAKNIYSLQCHISRIHRSRKLVYCDYCAKSFTRKSVLVSHIWKHMGLEPFKCSSCPSSYSCNSKLQAHIMMKHTGERPFQCQYCNYGSVTQRQLNVHMESHLNEQKYKCDMCPYTANRKATLVKHQKTSCGQLTRKYSPIKNKAAIDFTQLGHPMAEDGEPSDRV